MIQALVKQSTVFLAQRQGVPSNTHHSSLDVLAPDQHVVIRRTRQSTLRRSVLTLTQINILADSGSRLIAILRKHWTSNLGKDATLHKNLCTHPRVNASINAVEVTVEDMAGTKPDSGRSAVDILPVVIAICHTEMTGMFVAVVIAMANKRCFPVIMKAGVGDSNVVGGVCDVTQPIIVILIMVHVGAEITVIDPDIRRLLNPDGVVVVRHNSRDCQILYYDIRYFFDVKSNATEARLRVRLKYGLVAADVNGGAS